MEVKVVRLDSLNLSSKVEPAKVRHLRPGPEADSFPVKARDVFPYSIKPQLPLARSGVINGATDATGVAAECAF
jgi:hypothetical protein